MRGLVSARKLRSIVALTERAGIPRSTLLAAVGINPADLDREEHWLPLGVWRDLWIEAVSRTGDPTLGLRAARQTDRGYFGVLDYVIRSSPNIGAAMRVATRYFRLANSQGELRIVDRGVTLVIERHIHGDEALLIPRQAAEFALAAMVHTFRRAAAAPWQPTAVRFRYPAVDYAPQLEAHFECPVSFGAATDAIEVARSVLAVPMTAPDAVLRALVESHAETLLAQMPGPSLVAQVRHLVAADLRDGAPSADRVAAALGMSRRSLSRRLRAHQTTFTRIVEALRHALARRYLGSAMTIGEVAFLLGYADVPAFHRAFRGWAGLPPGEWRARNAPLTSSANSSA